MTDGAWLELQDYFWSLRTYEEVLIEAGFTDVQIETPLLADAYGLAESVDLETWDYETERVHPPLLLISGVRPEITTRETPPY